MILGRCRDVARPSRIFAGHKRSLRKSTRSTGAVFTGGVNEQHGSSPPGKPASDRKENSRREFPGLSCVHVNAFAPGNLLVQNAPEFPLVMRSFPRKP